MKAMIFAAGLGTRLKPLTDTTPKALVPINGKPLLEHLILKMKAANFNEIAINVHHFPEQIIDFLRNNNNFGIRIEVSDERNLLLETGGGLRKMQAFFDDKPFLVHNVDILSNLDFAHLVQAHQSSDMATLVVSDRKTARYLLFDQAEKLVGWVNKQTGETKPTTLYADDFKALAFSGVQVMSSQIFERMKDFPDKFSMIDVYLQNCQTSNMRAYVPQNYRMMDVGKIDCISDAQKFLETV